MLWIFTIQVWISSPKQHSLKMFSYTSLQWLFSTLNTCCRLITAHVFFFCSWVSKTNRCAPSVSAPCVWFSMPDVHDRRILCNVPAFFSLFFSLIWQAVLHIWLTNTHILLHGVSAEPKPEPQLLIFTLFLCIVALQGQWWKIYERHRR